MQAFLDVYLMTFDEKWLHLSAQLADYVWVHFQDSKNNLFKHSQDTTLFFQDVPVTDGVLPSANAAIALALQQLGTLLNKPIYLEKATKMFEYTNNLVETAYRTPFYYYWCKGHYRQMKPPFEVAIVGQDAQKIREQLVKHYLPNTYILGATQPSTLELLNNKFKKGETWIYVCQNKACKQPVKTIQAALKMMGLK
jgi:uncharacterized protein YyaL (SSP411 family)